MRFFVNKQDIVGGWQKFFTNPDIGKNLYQKISNCKIFDQEFEHFLKKYQSSEVVNRIREAYGPLITTKEKDSDYDDDDDDDDDGDDEKKSM